MSTSSTSTTRRLRRSGLAVALTAALTVPVVVLGEHPAAAASLNVDLASTRGPATGVGEGFLYGLTADGAQPGNQFVTPLRINAFRGGGHVSRGWIGDGFRFGSGTQADINSVISTARRLTGAQYQVILSDIWGADGGQPANAMFPCDNGDCANWVSFLDAVVPALQNSGLRFAYDVWNEPDISIFWPRGTNSAQYFQMWDTGVREIRRLAAGALVVGPSLAFTPQGNAGEWNTWLAHVRTAGTVPDWITNHLEGDVDDPVTVAQAVNNAMASNGVASRPLSANEYQPQDRQNAGATAWYLARLAQSSYTNAMRGNWVCCLLPNLAGILTNDGGSANGHWWVYRAYADMTGSLVTTSGQVGSTAISAAVDSAARRAVAILGDVNGFTGNDTVAFSGLSSVPALVNNGRVHVQVQRIPDQSPLGAPQIVLNQDMTVSGGSITVPVTFQAAHDAFAVYLTPGDGSGGTDRSGRLVGTGSGRCLDVTGVSQNLGTTVQIWDCNGQVNQFWHQTAAGELRVYNDTRCLDASNQGTANGTRIIIWSCNGQTNQQWRFNADGSITGVQSGRCLDVSGARTANGTAVQLWDCNGQTNQKWTLTS
jgi:Ricin-type beta-trefoil lectin domain